MQSRRRYLTLLLCGVLLLSQLAGVHLHFAPVAHDAALHAVVAPEVGHHDHELVVASNLDDLHHERVHSAPEAMDVSLPHSPTGNPSPVSLLLLVAIGIALLSLSLSGRTEAPPAYRVPIPLRPPHLLPPSHGPPSSA